MYRCLVNLQVALTTPAWRLRDSLEERAGIPGTRAAHGLYRLAVFRLASYKGQRVVSTAHPNTASARAVELALRFGPAWRALRFGQVLVRSGCVGGHVDVYMYCILWCSC